MCRFSSLSLKILTLFIAKGVLIVSFGSEHLFKNGLFVDLILKSNFEMLP